MLLSEHVHCVALTFKMTEWTDWWICIEFCTRLEHSSMEIIWMIQKATAMGNWWLVLNHDNVPPHASCLLQSFLVKCQITQVTQPPLQPRFGALWLLAFPKTKITFEIEEISDHQWDSGKYYGAADGDWQNCVRTQGTTLKGTEVSLSYAQCFLYLVSSSINVSIFHITWLDTFWTDLEPMV